MNILADQSLSLKLQSYNTEITTLKSCKTFNCLTHPLFNTEQNPGQDLIKLSTAITSYYNGISLHRKLDITSSVEIPLVSTNVERKPLEGSRRASSVEQLWR